ncbi:hypothetical protein D3C71_1792530 [compost metagenome]
MSNKEDSDSETSDGIWRDEKRFKVCSASACSCVIKPADLAATPPAPARLRQTSAVPRFSDSTNCWSSNFCNVRRTVLTTGGSGYDRHNSRCISGVLMKCPPCSASFKTWKILTTSGGMQELTLLRYEVATITN